MVTEQNVGRLVQRTTEFENQLDEDERGTTGRLRHVCANLGHVYWSDGTSNCISVYDLELAS